MRWRVNTSRFVTPRAARPSLLVGSAGTNGEIASLKLVGDAFPTEYVLNAKNAPRQNTSDHEWLGELMFSYRLGTGAWQTALTQSSGDVRRITQATDAVTVMYRGSSSAQGIKNFDLVETYSLVDDYLYWQIALTNASSHNIEFGDIGLPLPFNEFWFADNDVIYETRTVYHSFTGQNSSYVVAQRPSGLGPFLLVVPGAATGAGFEYMDAWVASEHPGSAWAAGGGQPKWPNGLDVFYIHSNVIKRTGRGYLPNTSLTLSRGQSKTRVQVLQSREPRGGEAAPLRPGAGRRERRPEPYPCDYGDVPAGTAPAPWEDSPMLTPTGVNPYGTPPVTIPGGYILLNEGADGPNQVPATTQMSILSRVNDDIQFVSGYTYTHLPSWATATSGGRDRARREGLVDSGVV